MGACYPLGKQRRVHSWGLLANEHRQIGETQARAWLHLRKQVGQLFLVRDLTSTYTTHVHPHTFDHTSMQTEFNLTEWCSAPPFPYEPHDDIGIYPTACPSHIFFNQPPADKHLGSFLFLAPVITAAMSVDLWGHLGDTVVSSSFCCLSLLSWDAMQPRLCTSHMAQDPSVVTRPSSPASVLWLLAVSNCDLGD